MSGIEEWDDFDQQHVGELIKKFHHIFALDDTKLGYMEVVQHEIKLNYPKPFKDPYQRIPPNQYEEMRAHLNYMLKVGAIHKSVSPYASPIALVHKKDGLLRFSINLRKLNSRTIKCA